jgi:hypothetical protein
MLTPRAKEIAIAIAMTMEPALATLDFMEMIALKVIGR